MAGILTDSGGQELLSILFSSGTKPTSFTLKLCSVMTALADSDTSATHVIIAGGNAGYADATLTNNATIGILAGIPTATFPQQDFVFSGPLSTNPDVVGYQLFLGATVIAEEKFSTAFTPLTDGDLLSIIPQVKLGNGTLI